MRILYFHQHFSTRNGQAGTRSYEMAQRLLALGHQVTMVCGSYSSGCTDLEGPFVTGMRQGRVDGMDVIEFDLVHDNKDSFFKRSMVFLKFAFASVKLALREPYDVVFATTTPLTAGIPGIFARWVRRKPFVFEVRDLWPELPREMKVITNPVVLSALSFLEWASYRSANRCIALSPGIADGIRRRGVASDRITLIPNGCDLDLFNEKRMTGARPHRVRDSDLMAVYSGTHGVANGLTAVLAAARCLQARGRDDIKLVLAGDGREKTELQQVAGNQGLDNLIFLDPMPKIQLARLLASADVGLQCLANISAFYFGTSPNKFFDYLSAGLPVLINYPGWVAEMVRTERCGFAVSPDDAEAFADALELAASDREALSVMGDRARSLGERRFSRQQLADKWVAWVTAESSGV